MSYSRIGSRINSAPSSSNPTLATTPTFAPSFGSDLVFSHHQSIGAAYVWRSPYSLPTRPRELYAPISTTGQTRIEPSRQAPTHAQLPDVGVVNRFLLGGSSRGSKKTA